MPTPPGTARSHVIEEMSDHQKSACVGMLQLDLPRHSDSTTDTAQSINQSINQSLNQSVNQSINQSINRSINQSIKQSSNRTINQSKCKSIPVGAEGRRYGDFRNEERGSMYPGIIKGQHNITFPNVCMLVHIHMISHPITYLMTAHGMLHAAESRHTCQKVSPKMRS